MIVAAQRMGLKLCVFAIASYGSIHPAAIKLIKNIARYADYNASSSEIGKLVHRAMSFISVAVHNGNGRITVVGCDNSRPYTQSDRVLLPASGRRGHAAGTGVASDVDWNSPSSYRVVRSFSSVRRTFADWNAGSSAPIVSIVF